MKTVKDLGLSPKHLVEIRLIREREPQIFPSQYVVIEEQAVVVGDELGIKIASFPYDSYRRRRDGSYLFRSAVDDFSLRQGKLYQIPRSS